MKLLAVILGDLVLFAFALSQVLKMRRLRAERAASRRDAGMAAVSGESAGQDEGDGAQSAP
ncbi:MAG: hypothetical protein EA400_07135 [Chromatiaceae bacterium]|nr:MAG: hypothetical protein EA400_07135 [Chromatiaceae bacterium]